jgi:hypothetical protein
MVTSNEKFDPGLSRIIVICLSLAFTFLVGTMEALRVTPNGFAFAVTVRTAVVLVLAALVVIPCFYTLVYTGNKTGHRVAIVIIVSIGITGFFYPLRFVPHHQMRAIFGGLALAVVAIGMVAAFLLFLRHFLESDAAKNEQLPPDR